MKELIALQGAYLHALECIDALLSPVPPEDKDMLPWLYEAQGCVNDRFWKLEDALGRAGRAVVVYHRECPICGQMLGEFCELDGWDG